MRKSGILMHISSLPSEYGIGTLGKEAFRFIDFLKKSGQHYWQVLPVNPTSYGDSPYQSPSAFAGNPYFIDPQILIEEGLLKKCEADNYFFGADEKKVDYYLQFQNRYPMLRTAFSRFEKDDSYYKFESENAFWLDGYALFMTLKEQNHYRSWIYWDDKYKKRDSAALDKTREKHCDVIDFYKFLQYKFFSQWAALKKYANDNGIKIIGDMPIYVALDSADVWSHPELFMLDEDNLPTKVAGCPPDAFSEKGQLWGNPLYRWDDMERDGYSWWIERIKSAAVLYDRMRIDHFRGFESYYTIDYGNEDAVGGSWEKGPGMKLFGKIREALGDIDIIAEDLGFLTPEVLKLLSDSGYPGMKVMQFAFDPYGDSAYLPHNHIPKSVLYTGTHDNDTTRGWFDTLSENEKNFVCDYLRIKSADEAVETIVSATLASVCETVIIPIQDYMELGTGARMNTPSTLGGNWLFRICKDDLSDRLSEKISRLVHIYRR